MKQRAFLRLAAIAVVYCWSVHAVAAAGCLRSVPQALAKAIESYAKKVPDSYVAVLRDLNDDGLPEAVVFLTDSDFCGSGGCNLLVFQQRSHAWHLVSHTFIVKPPIRVLPQRQRGWHSLGVFVQGGGIIDGYTAVLPFVKSGYPINPTALPAFRAHNETAGDVLVSSYRCSRSKGDGGN